MSKGSAHRASRFKRGLHPKRKESIHGPWPGVPALESLLMGRDGGPGGERAGTSKDVQDFALPAAADQTVIAKALHGFDDPEGPEGTMQDEPEVELAACAFEVPPEEGLLGVVPGDGGEGPPPEPGEWEP